MSNDDSTRNLPDGDSESGGLIYQLLELVKKMDARLQNLEAKVDERLHDTRPLWEELKQRLDTIELLVAQTDQRFGAIEQRLDALEAEVKGLRADVEKGFSLLEIQMDKLSGDYTRVYARQRDQERRLAGLEEKAS